MRIKKNCCTIERIRFFKTQSFERKNDAVFFVLYAIVTAKSDLIISCILFVCVLSEKEYDLIQISAAEISVDQTIKPGFSDCTVHCFQHN